MIYYAIMNRTFIMTLSAFAFLLPALAARPSLFLSERIYAVPDVECNVYFKNVTDAALPNAYAWNVRCEVGRHENFRWTFLARNEDAGREFPLVLEMWNDAHGLVTAATTTVRVVKFPRDRTRKRTIALLGDSLTGCRFQDQAAQLMAEFGFTGYTTVGNRASERARHDGYGGFSWTSFMTRYALTTDEIDNVQSEAEREQLRKFGAKIPEGQEWRRALLKSPLVRIVNGQKTVDVQAWLDKVNGGVAPDVVIIELGTNDVFGDTEGNRLERLAKDHIPAAVKLLKTLRATMPTAVFAVMTIPPGADQDSFGANYGCAQSDFIFRRNILAYNRALGEMIATLGDTRIELVPAHVAVDTVYGSISRQQKANARSDRMVERLSNAVHFDVTGARQYGDALFAWLVDYYARW